VVDPNTPDIDGSVKNVTFITEKATTGMKRLKETLLKDYV
jgi:hypothetical protein